GLTEVGRGSKVCRLWIVMSKDTDPRADDVHRRRLLRQSTEQIPQRIGHPASIRQALLKIRQLRGRGQFSVKKQIGDFIKSRLLGQLRDRIASIAKAAADRGNSRLTGDNTFPT